MRKVSDFNFKVGDIVECVQASLHITKGIEYEIVHIDDEHVWVINDNNEMDFFLPERFYLGQLFKANDKIVCIDVDAVKKNIQKNKIYSVIDSKVNDKGVAIIFLLLDLGNSISQGCWFKAKYFEKVPEKQKLIFEQFDSFIL